MPSIFYREQGKGRPLILIHGFCETSEIWNHFADVLARKFNVITPDLPGFGKSPLPSNSFSIDEVGLLMVDWMTPWRADRPVVIGHSLGGYVTLAMVKEQPGAFAGFGLFHSTAYADAEEKKANRNKVMDFVKHFGVASFIDTYVPGLFSQGQHPSATKVHQIASRTNPQALLAYSAAMRDRHGYEELLVAFPRPILFIAGENDTLLPSPLVCAQSRLARFPVFHSLAEVGHMGMLEKEDVSLGIVEDFMNFCASFKAD